MEIDPSKILGQMAPGKQGQGSGADDSAFTAALEKARAEAGKGEAANGPGAAGAASRPSELVGMLRHQAVQGEGRMQQALDLVSSLSEDFARGRSPGVSELKGAEETLARLEGQAMGEEREWLRGVRSSVSFYLGRMEREQGGS